MAYTNQTKQLNDLITFNLSNSIQLQTQLKEREKALKKVEQINKQLNKKNRQVLPWVLGSATAGLIGGIILMK